MASALDDLRAWMKEAYKEDRQHLYAKTAKEERRRLKASMDIYMKLKRGEITREQANERINKELL